MYPYLDKGTFYFSDMSNLYNIRKNAKYELLALITGSRAESVKKYFNRRGFDTEKKQDLSKFILKFVIRPYMKENNIKFQQEEDDKDINFLDLDDDIPKENSEEEDEEQPRRPVTLERPVKKKKSITI